MERDRFSLEAGELKGRDAPAWLSEEPSLLPVERFLLDAFYELHAGNKDGIPWRDIHLFAEIHQLELDVAKTLQFTIRGLEAAWFEWRKEQEPS